MEFIGKNTDFRVVFNPSSQAYKVFHKDRDMGFTKYKFSEVSTYLN